jgi:tetratricopeptide (TPR) repeat protein
LGEAEKSREYLEKFSALKMENDKADREKRAGFAPLRITLKNTAQTHTDVGRVYALQNRPQEAEQLWLRAAALDPENTICRLNLAVFYQRTGQDRGALRLYEEIARIDPADGLVQLNLGRVSLKLRQAERAERAFREVIRLAPDRPDGYAALAELHLQSNRNLAEARRLAEAAVRLAPEAKYFAILGQACVMNGDRKGALTAMNKAIELQPDNNQYQRLLEKLLGGK